VKAASDGVAHSILKRGRCHFPQPLTGACNEFERYTEVKADEKKRGIKADRF